MAAQVNVETNAIPQQPNSVSLVSQIKKAKVESKDTAHFIRNSLKIYFESDIITYLVNFGIGLFFVVSIVCYNLNYFSNIINKLYLINYTKAMIVIGLYYKTICYINELIPIWMIVFGAVGFFIIILRLFSNIYSKCR